MSQAERCPGQRWIKLNDVRDSVKLKLSAVGGNFLEKSWVTTTFNCILLFLHSFIMAK